MEAGFTKQWPANNNMQATFPLHAERSVPPDKQRGVQKHRKQHHGSIIMDCIVQYVTGANENIVLSLYVSLLPSPWHMCCLDLYV